MDIMKSCGPVSVRPSGGVYFIPEQHAPTIESLKDFVKATTAYSVTNYRSSLYAIDVLDTDEYRQIVEESLEDQVNHESEWLVKEMVGILENDEKTLTQAAAQKYIERVQELDTLVAGYEDMLQTQIVSAQANVKLAMQQAMALLKQKVKVKW